MNNPVRLDVLYNNLNKQSLARTYRKLTLLDGTGACDIYLAEDSILGRTVIVRALKDKHVANQESRQAFIDCSLFQGSLPAMPNLATTFFINEDHAYVEMEQRNGPNLKEWLDTKPQPESRLKVIRHILEAVASLHAIGVYHGALTPRSIIIESDEKIILIGIGVLKLWSIIKGYRIKYAKRYLPKWWLDAHKSKNINVEQGFLADMYSVSVICKELWHYRKKRKPADIDKKVNEFMEEQLRSPSPNAQVALDIFTDKLKWQLTEQKFINEQIVRQKRHVNEARFKAIEYFDNCIKDWHRQFFIDSIIHILLTIGCLIGSIAWLYNWYEDTTQDSLWSKIITWGGCIIVPTGLIFITWLFWFFWRRSLIRQINYIMREYFEPRVAHGGCTWDEVMRIFEKYFFNSPNPFLFAVLYFKPKQQKESKKFEMLQKIRLISAKFRLFEIRLANIGFLLGIILLIIFFAFCCVLENEFRGIIKFIIGYSGGFILLLIGVIFALLIERIISKRRKSTLNLLRDIYYKGMTNGYLTRKEVLAEVERYEVDVDLSWDFKKRI